jgi:hypothetical protein
MNEKTDVFNMANIAEIYPDEKIIETKDGKKHQATSEIINKQLWPQRHPNRITDETSFLTWLRSRLHEDNMYAENAKEQRLNVARSAVGMLRAKEEKETVINDAYRGNIIDFDSMIANVRPKILAGIEASKKEQERREEENRLQTIERNRFQNKFLRLCTYLSVPEYQHELEYAAKTASLTELEEVQQQLLQNIKPELSGENRNLALAWLQAKINVKQEKQPTNKEGKPMLQRAKEELTQLVSDFRGH